MPASNYPFNSDKNYPSSLLASEKRREGYGQSYKYSNGMSGNGSTLPGGYARDSTLLAGRSNTDKPPYMPTNDRKLYVPEERDKPPRS